MLNSGLFVGLTTLDLIYLTAGPPAANQKIVALDYIASAGGPATNAAITFRYLGGSATLLSAIGIHPISTLIRSDLETQNISSLDLAPTQTDSPPVSSIVVTQATGERSVVSINAVKHQLNVNCIPPHILEGIGVVLIDGHQMEIGIEIATQARRQGIPIVVDGGSWKPGFDRLLPLVDYALCSADFRPPGCQTQADVLAYLSALGIPHLAISQGAAPIVFQDQRETGTVPVPQVSVVDTLGAGDVLHGAFCAAISHLTFTAALEQAARVASQSCQFFGTRQWMAASSIMGR